MFDKSALAGKDVKTPGGLKSGVCGKDPAAKEEAEAMCHELKKPVKDGGLFHRCAVNYFEVSLLNLLDFVVLV